MNLHSSNNIKSKREVRIPIPKGGELQSILVEGKEKGKTLVVTTGVHGCEYVGIQAVRELIDEISPEEMKGRVIFLPLVNESGFYEGAKQIVPEDGKNLNQSFPGSENGSISERIAYAIQTSVYKEADFLIDLHGGDVNESMIPLVFFPVGAKKELEEETRRATKNLSVSYRVQSYAKNGLYSYAAQCNIPALLIERGGEGKWNQEEVLSCKQNVYEIMDYLGIYSTKKNEKEPIEIATMCYEEAEEKGFWYCYKKEGDSITKGELLGQLVDCNGVIQKQYTAQFDGVVLYFTHALGVKKGDPVIAYGKI